MRHWVSPQANLLWRLQGRPGTLSTKVAKLVHTPWAELKAGPKEAL